MREASHMYAYIVIAIATQSHIYQLQVASLLKYSSHVNHLMVKLWNSIPSL